MHYPGCMDIKLTPQEVAGLREVGKLMARVLDDDVRNSLISKGLIVQKLGGLGRTSKGEQWLMHNR